MVYFILSCIDWNSKKLAPHICIIHPNRIKSHHIRDGQVSILGSLNLFQAEVWIRVHLVIDATHYKFEEMPGDVSSSEAHIQEYLDCAPWQLILRKVPDNPVSWNSDCSIVLIDLEKVLECLVLKLVVYSFQLAPRERLDVIAHCSLEILSLVLRLDIKFLVKGPHEVHLVLSQVTF